MNTSMVPLEKPRLPEVMSNTLPSIGSILSSFNLPREVIASNEEIESAWNELPRELARIPPELRDGLVARMCVATSVGLFDGAINYIWNAVILNLRLRVKNFGLGYIAQILNKRFEEDDLNDLRDAELLDLCHKLELLSEDGYFFLSQCRDIRNNFSSAHPSMAQIDDRELINFISRCCKHGISSEYTLQGINIAEFITTIKKEILNHSTVEAWKLKLENTFPAQRVLLIPTLHGIYCDPNSKEHARVNALSICQAIRPLFDSKIQSSLIEKHNSYLTKNDEQRTKASRIFFQKLDILDLLTDVERHSIIKSACDSLFQVHQGFDNFYNEPPFAENLYKLTRNAQIPDSTKVEFVETVVTCYVGNPYGVSHAAVPFYKKIIENFSPKEIEAMLDIPAKRLIVAGRITTYSRCKERYIQALGLLNEKSLSTSQKNRIDKLKRNL